MKNLESMQSIEYCCLQDIKDAELPELYICAPVDADWWSFWEENGYDSDWEYFMGYLRSGGHEFITWEGINNISYEEITGEDVLIKLQSK